MKCYWEHPWGTYWEFERNIKGTCWEQRKNEKQFSPHPHQKLRRKKIKAPSVHDSTHPLATYIFGL